MSPENLLLQCSLTCKHKKEGVTDTLHNNLIQNLIACLKRYT
jgi:hypothetical protein